MIVESIEKRLATPSHTSQRPLTSMCYVETPETHINVNMITHCYSLRLYNFNAIHVLTCVRDEITVYFNAPHLYT